MGIEELWPQLEAARTAAQARRGAPAGWTLRQLRPDPACPLSAGLELTSGRRGLLLRIPRALVPAKRLWPACRGLEMLAAGPGSEVLFGVALKEARHGDLFTALAEDLARRVVAAGDPPAQVAALLAGLARWQKFLAARGEGLGEEAQRGLWGELHFLRTELLPRFTQDDAVAAWQGPTGTAQDFLLPMGAVEVKTTAAKPPYVVPISSERQLDDRGHFVRMMRAWYEGVALRNAPVWAVCIETLQQHGIMASPLAEGMAVTLYAIADVFSRRLGDGAASPIVAD